MKNKDAILQPNAVFTVLLLIFVVFTGVYILSERNGAGVWSDYYAKEISKVINLAKPGDLITLNVQKATEIAEDNDVLNFKEIFMFNNEKKEICVKLAKGEKTCYNYFNNVYIIPENPDVDLGVPVNIIKFRISEVENV